MFLGSRTGGNQVPGAAEVPVLTDLMAQTEDAWAYFERLSDEVAREGRVSGLEEGEGVDRSSRAEDAQNPPSAESLRDADIGAKRERSGY